MSNHPLVRFFFVIAAVVSIVVGAVVIQEKFFAGPDVQVGDVVSFGGDERYLVVSIDGERPRLWQYPNPEAFRTAGCREGWVIHLDPRNRRDYAIHNIDIEPANELELAMVVCQE